MSRALEALESLYPEYLDRLEHLGTRGLLDMSAAARLGNTLLQCESFVGFPTVLKRLRQGEGSASAELHFAASLHQLGIVPELEPALAGKRPDLRFPFAGQTIFAEVISPDRSDAIVEAEQRISRLADMLTASCPGKNVELLLSSAHAVESLTDIASAVAAAPVTNAIQDIAGVGRLLKKASPQSAVVSPSIPHVIGGPHIGVSRAVHDPGGITVSAVRLPIDDQRAQRILSDELRHFQRDETNLLMMDVTQVLSGMRGWKKLLLRCFQPTRNLRIGAVVLFEGGIVAPQSDLWERWQVLRNPHALLKPPEALLQKIEALDDGPYQQVPKAAAGG